MKRYFDQTSTLTYSYLISIPLLILYEVLIRISQPAEEAMVRLSAEIWITRLLMLIHHNTIVLTTVLVIVLGVFIFWKDREKSIHLKTSYFGWMVAESIVWAVLLAFLVGGLVGWIFMFSADAPAVTRLQMLALSIGAGLYEELVFRVVLVYGLIYLFNLLFERKTAVIISVILAAAIFSGVHYTGSMGDVFTLPSFMFRMIFGLALNALLVIRGFGITAWTHSLYDVLLVIFLY